eukprot:361689-Chlamydomonas_euryale.AAC.20
MAAMAAMARCCTYLHIQPLTLQRNRLTSDDEKAGHDRHAQVRMGCSKHAHTKSCPAGSALPTQAPAENKGDGCQGVREGTEEVQQLVTCWERETEMVSSQQPSMPWCHRRGCRPARPTAQPRWANCCCAHAPLACRASAAAATPAAAAPPLPPPPPRRTRAQAAAALACCPTRARQALPAVASPPRRPQQTPTNVRVDRPTEGDAPRWADRNARALFGGVDGCRGQTCACANLVCAPHSSRGSTAS